MALIYLGWFSTQKNIIKKYKKKNENKKALLKKLQLEKEATPASKNIVVAESRKLKIKFDSKLA